MFARRVQMGPTGATRVSLMCLRAIGASIATQRFTEIDFGGLKWLMLGIFCRLCCVVHGEKRAAWVHPLPATSPAFRHMKGHFARCVSLVTFSQLPPARVSLATKH